MASAVVIAFTAIVAFLLLRSFTKQKPPASYPPGPAPLPVIGNIRDLTAKELWLVAARWAKQFGKITYIHVFGQGIVFLNTSEAVFDLLERRGALYSDKPHLVMAGELCGCENMVAFTPYGDMSRRQRKLMQSALGPSSIKNYHPLLELETRPFLRRLLAEPEKYTDHIARYAGGLTLLVVYGHQVKSNEDKFLKLAEECVSLLSNRIASGGGIWPVDIFPSLRHIPTWMPGAGFKRNAMIWKAKMEEFVDRPYEFVKDQMRKGTARPSFVSTLLESDAREGVSTDSQRDFDIRWTANSMYSASIDTKVTAISHFILAMVQHPAVLVRAQAELDSVVGSSRLPTFSDRPDLPYCEAVFAETFRWGVPVPLNLPHRLMEDDIYEGMFLPKGSLVFGNIWSILRDENLFPDPHAFKPERYLEPAANEVEERKRDPRTYVFGFGRRRCPGAYLVESSAWLLMVSMMSTLNFGKAFDSHGNVIEPEVKFENAVFRLPNVFQCDIRPRSEQALKIVSEL